MRKGSGVFPFLFQSGTSITAGADDISPLASDRFLPYRYVRMYIQSSHRRCAVPGPICVAFHILQPSAHSPFGSPNRSHFAVKSFMRGAIPPAQRSTNPKRPMFRNAGMCAAENLSRSKDQPTSQPLVPATLPRSQLLELP